MTEQKLCECGCGEPTPLCQYTNRNYGYVKGEPLRFIPGHHKKLIKWTDERRQSFKEKMSGKPRSKEIRQKISEAHKALGTRPSPEAIAKSNENRPTGEDSPQWKGGITITNGYRCVLNREHPRAHPNGYVYEHVVVAEAKLGRPLTKGEVVHHIDLDKTNNHPDNLQVFASQTEHVKFHQELKRNG